MDKPLESKDGYTALHPNLETLLSGANVDINGVITDATLTRFLEQLSAVRKAGQALIMEINTSGGDADIARRIALEIRLFRRHSGRTAYCVGKSAVYSAGVTIFAAFPIAQRFLTEDAVLLIHERRLEKTISLNGPIQANLQIVREQLSLLETAARLEEEGFKELVEGSRLSIDTLREHMTNNCYLSARKAHDLGIIAEILG